MDYAKNFALGIIAGLIMFGPALVVILWKGL